MRKVNKSKAQFESGNGVKLSRSNFATPFIYQTFHRAVTRENGVAKQKTTSKEREINISAHIIELIGDFSFETVRMGEDGMCSRVLPL